MEITVKYCVHNLIILFSDLIVLSVLIMYNIVHPPPILASKLYLQDLGWKNT